MRRTFFILASLVVVVGCKSTLNSAQSNPGKRFVAVDGADVAKQIAAYSAEYALALSKGDALPELTMKDGKVFESGKVTNFREFASSADRQAFETQFPTAAGNDYNEAKAQAFENFVNTASSGSGFGRPSVVHANAVDVAGCGFPIVFFPCVQFGMPGVCVNCFAAPGGCNVGANAWACGFTVDCNRCFPL